ncbi:MAG: FAD-dependent oxidoreductase [Acidimicrobiales bacterium]
MGAGGDLARSGAGKAELDDGEVIAYDEAVLATGSSPFVPPLPGADLDGCSPTAPSTTWPGSDWAEPSERVTGVGIGGGLLGLEAANALRSLGLDVHVIEMAPTRCLASSARGRRMLARWVGRSGATRPIASPGGRNPRDAGRPAGPRRLRSRSGIDLRPKRGGIRC